MSWSSSNESVATVDENGLVTAIAIGTAEITVTTEDGGFTDSVNITVEGETLPEGFVLWLDANDYNKADGVWEDKSDRNNEIRQNNASNRPDLVENGINGNPVVRFNGSNQYLNLDWQDDALKTDSITILIIVKYSDFYGGSQTIMGNFNSTGEVCIHKSGSENVAYAHISKRDNSVDFGELGNDNAYLLTFKYDDSTGTHEAFLDGSLKESKTIPVDINWQNTSIGRNRISSSNTFYWKGDIGEIMIFDRALSDAERMAVEQELGEKWLGWKSEYTGTSVLYNPYGKVNWDQVKHYKANFHTHTNKSDGSISPADVIDAYYNAGYKILALTDHDTFGGIDTTWPWTDYGKNPKELGMLAVEGNEISAIDNIGSLFNDYGGAKAGEEAKALQEIANRNGLAIIYHPGRYNRTDEWYKNLFENYYLNPLVGMEVYNQGDRYMNDRDRWDRLNALVMPDKVIFGYSNDDMHNTAHLYGNYQFMLMDDLSEEELIEAMLSGAFYFCREHGKSGAADPPVPLIEKIDISKDGTVITITARNIENDSAVVWRTNKRVVGTGRTINLKELDLLGEKFVRAEITNSCGITYTQPFVLKHG